MIDIEQMMTEFKKAGIEMNANVRLIVMSISSLTDFLYQTVQDLYSKLKLPD